MHQKIIIKTDRIKFARIKPKHHHQETFFFSDFSALLILFHYFLMFNLSLKQLPPHYTNFYSTLTKKMLVLKGPHGFLLVQLKPSTLAKCLELAERKAGLSD